ncbi:uncharacterized protein LOC144917221 [Branchiostoma floridae x Branchiostoma belcheri]
MLFLSSLSWFICSSPYEVPSSTVAKAPTLSHGIFEQVKHFPHLHYNPSMPGDLPTSHTQTYVTHTPRTDMKDSDREYPRFWLLRLQLSSLLLVATSGVWLYIRVLVRNDLAVAEGSEQDGGALLWVSALPSYALVLVFLAGLGVTAYACRPESEFMVPGLQRRWLFYDCIWWPVHFLFSIQVLTYICVDLVPWVFRSEKGANCACSEIQAFGFGSSRPTASNTSQSNDTFSAITNDTNQYGDATCVADCAAYLCRCVMHSLGRTETVFSLNLTTISDDIKKMYGLVVDAEATVVNSPINTSDVFANMAGSLGSWDGDDVARMVQISAVILLTSHVMTWHHHRRQHLEFCLYWTLQTISASSLLTPLLQDTGFFQDKFALTNAIVAFVCLAFIFMTLTVGYEGHRLLQYDVIDPDPHLNHVVAFVMVFVVDVPVFVLRTAIFVFYCLQYGFHTFVEVGYIFYLSYVLCIANVILSVYYAKKR